MTYVVIWALNIKQLFNECVAVQGSRQGSFYVRSTAVRHTRQNTLMSEVDRIGLYSELLHEILRMCRSHTASACVCVCRCVCSVCIDKISRPVLKFSSVFLFLFLSLIRGHT